MIIIIIIINDDDCYYYYFIIIIGIQGTSYTSFFCFLFLVIHGKFFLSINRLIVFYNQTSQSTF